METLRNEATIFWRETRFQQVREQIEVLAYQLGPEGKLPGMRELGEQMGVSVNTVSGALEDLASRGIVCRKHGVGVFVAPTLTSTICLVASPDFYVQGHSPFWDELLRTLRDGSLQHNERFEMHFAQSSATLGSLLEEGLSARIAGGRIQGVIGLGLVGDAIQLIEKLGVPFVSLFGPLYSERGASVLMNICKMLEMGVEVLAGKGCRRIQCWAGAHPLQTRREIEDRPSQHRDVFLAALASQNLSGDERDYRGCWELLSLDQSARLSIQEQGFDLARRVFGLPRSAWPDGIVMMEDLLCHGALMGFKTLDVQVGHDLHIATHANSPSPVLIGHPEPVTLLEFDINEIVKDTHNALQSLMQGQTLAQPYNYVLPRIRPLAASYL